MTTVDGLFTGSNVKTRIPNPETLPDNPIHMMRNGWGLTYLGGTLLDGEFKNIVIQHTFNIVLTREVVKTDSQTTALDTANKNLLEDAQTIQNDFYDVDKIGLSSAARQIIIGDNSAIDFIVGDKLNFRSMSIPLLFDVAENLV